MTRTTDCVSETRESLANEDWDRGDTDDGHVKEEENEVLQISLPDAVGDPAAVMVHAEDATPARAAVMGARRLHALTSVTVVHELCLQVVDLVFRQVYVRAGGAFSKEVHNVLLVLLSLSFLWEFVRCLAEGISWQHLGRVRVCESGMNLGR